MADVDVDVLSTALAFRGAMDINTALQDVLQKSLIADGLVHGLHQAVLCILAETLIPLIRVDSHKKLSEWSGLCKIEKESKSRKVCGGSDDDDVINDFGEETPALDVVRDHFTQNS